MLGMDTINKYTSRGPSRLKIIPIVPWGLSSHLVPTQGPSGLIVDPILDTAPTKSSNLSLAPGYQYHCIKII